MRKKFNVCYVILALMNPLFLALKAKLNNYDTLKSDFSDSIKGRWTAEENLHLTICYFGNIYTLDELLEKLPSTIKKIEPLTLTSLDYFSHNKILYAKPNGYSLDMLHSSICAPFSLKSAAGFIPHVTLMRIKKIENDKAFKEMLNRYKNKNIGNIETTLELMQSRQSADGSRYNSIKKFY